MDTNELELLKKVLPDGYEVVNEGKEENGHSLLAIWDGDDWQHEISTYETAQQVITKILAVEKAASKEWGAAGVRQSIKQLLCIDDDIERRIMQHLR